MESELSSIFWVKLVAKIISMLKCFQVAELHLVIYKCLKSSIFQEKQYYISTSLLIVKDFLTSNDFFVLKFICRSKFYKTFYHPTKTLDLSFFFFVFIFQRLCFKNFAVEWSNKGTSSFLLIYHLLQDF